MAFASGQSPLGGIAGTVRSADGVLPGATVTATTGHSQYSAQFTAALTGTSGRYRLGGLPPGTYRVEAQAGGMRRAVAESIVVRAGVDTDCDLILEPGILTVVDYGSPDGGLAGALAKAAVVVHLRIAQIMGPRLLGEPWRELTTEHVARILAVLKDADRGLTPGSTSRFWQAEAGEWTEDGQRYVGENKPYRLGDEFVGLFKWDQERRLREFVGGHFMFRVIDGRVRYQAEPAPGIQDGMPVDGFIAALRKLIATPHP
jgi:hypothetical protein